MVSRVKPPSIIHRNFGGTLLQGQFRVKLLILRGKIMPPVRSAIFLKPDRPIGFRTHTRYRIQIPRPVL